MTFTEETKEKLLEEMEKYFGDDMRRIAHAKKVMGFAEELLKKESSANRHIESFE